jgi:hypothetical protein
MAQRGATSAFFALAFAFTWALQLPGVFARWGWLPGDPAAYLPVAMLGIFGPLVAAIILTFMESAIGFAAMRSTAFETVRQVKAKARLRVI